MYLHKQDDVEHGEEIKLLLVDATPDIRSGFVKKVYGLVGVQLLLTFGWMLLVSSQQDVQSYVLHTPGVRTSCSILGLVLICPLMVYKDRYPLNLVLLLGFTMCEAYTLGVLGAAYAAQTQNYLIVFSLGLTMTVFVILSSYVHVTQRDMSFLEEGLTVTTLTLVGMGLFAMFLPYSSTLHLFVSGVGVIVFSGYVLYDTSTMIHYMTPDDAVIAAVQLYLDIINLFLCILQLFSTRE